MSNDTGTHTHAHTQKQTITRVRTTCMTSLYPFLAMMSLARAAMVLPSTAKTRLAPARAQNRDKIPVPAPTSITTASGEGADENGDEQMSNGQDTLALEKLKFH